MVNVAMTGYNIECDAGDLYTRRCRVDGKDIVSYTSKGQPVTIDHVTGETHLWVLDQDGNAYKPYGDTGVPYTAGDAGPLSSILGGWRAASGADPQWFTRLMTLPGANARVRAANTSVPWYYPTFGLKKRSMPTTPSGVVTERSLDMANASKALMWGAGFGLAGLGALTLVKKVRGGSDE